MSVPPSTNRTRFHSPFELSRLDLGKLAIRNRFRGHPQLDRIDHQRLLRHDLSDAATSGGRVASIQVGGEISAVCAIKPLTWDTTHFGIPMAKLILAAAPDCDPRRLQYLVDEIASSVSTHISGAHISCEIDIDDYLCTNVLIARGARIFDIKREYRCISIEKVAPPKFLSRVRAYRPEDKEAVMKLLEEASFETRFSRDPMLDPRKTEEMYRIWLERLLAGDTKERIALVMERNGRVQACGTIERYDLGFAEVQLQLMSGGIYISSPSGTGGYYPILYSLIAEAEKRGMTSQTCVSLNNHSAAKVLDRMNVGTASIRYSMRLSE